MHKVELGTTQPSTVRREGKPLVQKGVPPSEQVGAKSAMRDAVKEGAREAQSNQADEEAAERAERMILQARAARVDWKLSAEEESAVEEAEDSAATGDEAANDGDGETTVDQPAADSSSADDLGFREEDLSTRQLRYTPSTPQQIERDKRRYLVTLEVTGSSFKALAAIKRTRSCVDNWRRKDKAFASALADIWETKIDRLEDSVLSRATDGIEKPVYQQGMLVGTETVHYPGLSTFMLSKLRPAVYGNRAEDSSTLTPQDQAELARAFMRAMESIHQPASGDDLKPRAQAQASKPNGGGA